MPAANAQLASEIPQVSQDDLCAFHEAHFAQDAVSHFSGTFMKPASGTGTTPATDDWTMEEEDDLGYYADGVKRTLTDEQIEIFRHSELQQLRKAAEKRAAKAGPPTLSEGELSDAVKSTGNTASHDQGAPKKKKKKTAKQPREPKPDLRKRTWDVVEAGLDTLEYD